MEIITEKCGFNGVALMALYACDIKQQEERDPRRHNAQRPSRLKDVIQLYFEAYKGILPGICPLDFLAKTLVEFCRQNHTHAKEVTSTDQAKFNEALKQLAHYEQQKAMAEQASFIKISIHSTLCMRSEF